MFLVKTSEKRVIERVKNYSKNGKRGSSLLSVKHCFFIIFMENFTNLLAWMNI
jgi:hypothetical protein